MAIYHFSGQIIGRKTGRSSVAAAAYRSGTRLIDSRTGEIHDFRGKRGVDFSTILGPENAPEWIYSRVRLWDSIEAKETRSDAQLAREFNIALPLELDRHAKVALALEFVQREFVERGMVAQLDLHDLNSGNPHFHVMLSLRDISENGWGHKNRSWNQRDLLLHWRKAWADMANAHLERAACSERIDHRSLLDQGIDREPTRHLGPHAAAVERKEARTSDRRRQMEADLAARAQKMAREKIEAAALAAQIASTEAELVHLANELDDYLAREKAEAADIFYAQAETAMAAEIAEAQATQEAATRTLEAQQAELRKALAAAKQALTTHPTEAVATDSRVQAAREAVRRAALQHTKAADARWKARDEAENATEAATTARQAVAEWRQAHRLAAWWHDHLRPIARLSQLTEAANQAALTSRDAQEQAKIAERHAIAAADTQRARTAKQVRVEASVRAEAQQLAQAEVTRIEAALSALEPLQPPITSQTDQTLAWVRDRLLGQKPPAGPPIRPDRER